MTMQGQHHSDTAKAKIAAAVSAAYGPWPTIPSVDTLVCAWPQGCDRMAEVYDHDHDTDTVRAALCGYHNRTLAACGDSPAVLHQLAAWLEDADLGFTYSDVRRKQAREWHRQNKGFR